ncbi:MAG: penicillin-binding protein 2 [Chloroflexi bacterium]|nr:penicillin-binding protein 2 [Chloroflexota bacterium]
MSGLSAARLRTLFALFAVLTIILSVRVAYWQTVARGELLARATGQVRSDEVLRAQRGTIRDRSGAILAATVQLRSVYAIPARIKDKAAAARSLGVLLGRDSAPILERLRSDAEWVFIQRRIPEAAAEAIARLGIDGLGSILEPKRLYPNDDLAAHVLGFVNDDGAGQGGVEGRYDALLRGEDGTLVVERDPADRGIALGLRQAVAPRDGAALTLTIDLAVQTAAERALREAIDRERAASGSIVVLDPRDGAVRAMASLPTFHPAAVATATPESLRSRAIAWEYEPGSTLKAITMAAGLDTGAVTPSSWYDDKGYADIGGRRLLNALGRAWGPTNMTQVLERSANAGAVYVGSRLGAQRLYDAIGTFGLGRPTGIDLAGEVGGTVRPLAEWYPVDVGTAAFGQGLTVTPLQLACAYAAIANGGTLYRPYVVASWRDADGEHRTAPATTGRVVSRETAATLRDMLVSAVDNGLAQGARIAGFSVAGKTGTAQIPSPDGRYVDDEYISSFAGFAPAIDPSFVVVIVLERPASKLLGTTTAMAAFTRVAQDTFRYARIQPDRRP